MKAIFSLMLLCIGITKVVHAQDTLSAFDPNFMMVDTIKTEAMSMASNQPRVVKVSAAQVTKAKPTPSQSSLKNLTVELNPTFEWSNPPGFMGYRKGDIILNQRKPISDKKYHRLRKNRCYPF
jgi:hypothetical protein